MSGIKDKVIIITGAGRGIGEASALLLAERGAKLVLAARRENELASVAEKIAAIGGECVYRSTDVRKRADMEALVALSKEKFGRLDVFVGNAGIGPISMLDELRVEDWENLIDINTKGIMYGIAAALPVFREQKDGHFVHVLSTSGLTISPTMAVYAASKNAARTITEGLRIESGPNLRVTAISPGFINTDFADSMTDAAVANQIRQMRDQIAIGPDAIARTIVFAIEQPRDVNVDQIVIRPTAQA